MKKLPLYQSILYALARWLFALPFLAIFVLLALVERTKPKPSKPRIFWGTIPQISIKYQSQAIKRLGYTSATVVRTVYSIHSRGDYDYLMTEFVERLIPLPLPRLVKYFFSEYITFWWALPRFDIFVFYFGGTILKYSALQYLELELLKLAGKKTVFTAYGADVQATSRARGLLFKHANAMDYPAFTRQERLVLRNIYYACERADYIIAGADWVDFLPWWDKIVAGHFAIDTDVWKPCRPPSHERSDRPVRILHAPNHRELKGTRLVMRACEELKAEGVPIELVVAEKMTNAQVRELMQDCDIVADQFIIGWYAQFALEGMSMGKPVLCYLREDLLELYTINSFAGECPIVNTPPLKIKAVLRDLALDSRRRTELGARGRAYVEKHHSLDATGKMFDEVFQRVWQCERAR